MKIDEKRRTLSGFTITHLINAVAPTRIDPGHGYEVEGFASEITLELKGSEHRKIRDLFSNKQGLFIAGESYIRIGYSDLKGELASKMKMKDIEMLDAQGLEMSVEYDGVIKSLDESWLKEIDNLGEDEYCEIPYICDLDLKNN